MYALSQNVRYVRDSDKGVGVDGSHNGFQPCDLEAIYYKVDDGLLLSGVKASGVNVGDAPAEGLRQRPR